MRKYRLFLVIFVLTGTILACTTSTTIKKPSATPISTEPGYHLLVVVDGEVLLKRDGWISYHSTSFGTELHRGDLIKPSKNAKAVILCDNLTIWSVPTDGPSGISNGCTQGSEAVLTSVDSLIGNTRGKNESAIPYVISPRATQLLNNRPILSWNSVITATKYIVQIIDTKNGSLYWESQTDQQRFVYPDDQPALQPGVVYLLQVKADTGSTSRDEDVTGLGFSLMDENQTKQVQVYADKIETLTLPVEAQTYALAQLYARYGLFAEAINLLETQVNSGSQTTAVYSFLGDLYLGIGLHSLAEESYIEALTLAQTGGDAEALAAIHGKLGDVYINLGKNNLAVQEYTLAKNGFSLLGDSANVEDIEKKLRIINP